MKYLKLVYREICICFLKNNQRKKLDLIPKKNDQNEQCDYGVEKKTDLFM